VTFRLADSMPRLVVQSFVAELERLVAIEEQSPNRELTVAELRRAKLQLRKNIEKYLDAGRGACHLARADCARVVRDALLFCDAKHYCLGAWVVMPNHVHVLVKPLAGFELDAVVRSWKRFTAREVNRLIGGSGRLWQSEPFDHVVRSHERFLGFTRYILENPSKAGLVDCAWVGVGSLGDGSPPE